ncbi:MAG: hypothetical protein ACHQ50_07640, partial [Fimbriimonadales bacterium]
MKHVLAFAVTLLAGIAVAQKHPFGVDDWASLRGVVPVSVAADGTILYEVTHGGQAGPDVEEWHLMAADGSNKRRIELPEGFHPSGFTKDGSLYGAYVVNKLPQLAIFPSKDLKSTTVPTRVIFLPSGVGSVSLSPDGERFAILVSPRPPEEKS